LATHPGLGRQRLEAVAESVATAEYDLLRDEGQAFSGRLAAAGVDTTLVHYDDMNHGFLGMAGSLDRADEAMAAAGAWLAARTMTSKSS
jgi:acetyl esterase